eukprot:CAMPEP_0201596662 /NCGR_PEP_ID=MMETSP0190_2-20130828/193302_1 /ASSEMBLY_ACC=CAM_ASM_000263 /TAXON_ID=37353 /ORGANISM="Rosalina sp." /LENGTH=177 /DNA_ID=CAMNT_0048057149 /DNA_START=193 /DNA_END=727 /DNA_ORIENTATION=-
MMISDADDLITVTLSGPSSKYYSIGIGSCVMENTWALVIPGIDAPDGSTPFEQLLGRNSAGSQLDSSFDIIQDTTSGLLRSVTFTRSISTFQTDDSITDDEYYDFTTNDESLTVMWALEHNLLSQIMDQIKEIVQLYHLLKHYNNLMMMKQLNHSLIISYNYSPWMDHIYLDIQLDH